MDDPDQHFYAVIGELALQYSMVEYAVGTILQFLIDPGNPAVGGLTIRNLQLEARLHRVKELAQYRLCRDEALLTRVRDAMRTVNAIRSERNEFIHGQWTVNPDDLKRGIARCIDSRWRTIKGQARVEWVGFEEKQYTFAALKERGDHLASAILSLMKIRRDLDDAKLLDVSPTVLKTARPGAIPPE